MYNEIFALIPEGKKNACTAKELQHLLGCDHTREVTKLIHNLRVNKYIICACGSGYYRPSSDSEIKSFHRKTLNRIKEIQNAIQPTSDYLNGIQGGDDV